MSMNSVGLYVLDPAVAERKVSVHILLKYLILLYLIKQDYFSRGRCEYSDSLKARPTAVSAMLNLLSVDSLYLCNAFVAFDIATTCIC